MKNAVILARVSDPKQKIKGDSLEDQLIKCNKFIVAQESWHKDREFTLVESGRKGERKYFWEVFDYCKAKMNKPDKIDYVVVLNIGRFTRGGGEVYLRLKRQFEEINVRIMDINKTVGDKVNTMEEYGEKYDWSEYSPSEPAEVYEANQRRDYVRDQLTQMISGCIRNIRKGYWNGPAPFGLATKKVEINGDGIRAVLIEKPDSKDSREAFYIKRMFELRAQGLDDATIAKSLNEEGFHSRICAKRDKVTLERIGTRGGVPLTVKKIQELIVNTAYVGVIIAKWTQYQPVKASLFDGIIDVDVFNRANRGKIYVIKNGDGTVQVKHNVNLARLGQGIKRMRYNPKFPFKCVMRCPLCGREVKASSPRNGSGELSPRYHCDREHKYWSKDLENVHTVIMQYISKLKFSMQLIDLFQGVFLEQWELNNIKALDDSKEAENFVSRLVEQQKESMKNFREATSAAIKKAFEDEYDALDIKIKEARSSRDQTEKKELDIKEVLREARRLMERPEELLIDKENMIHQRQLFGLVFEEIPTYDDFNSGTAKLRPLFLLNSDENVSKSTLVHS